MEGVEMTSNRPYLIRALCDWILDNGLTPLVLVNARYKDARVPPQFIEDGKIVLNISPSASHDLLIANESVSFSARFGGRPYPISIPVNAIMAIYARENGKGMVFPDEPTDNSNAQAVPEPKKTRPVLKVVD